MEEPSISTLYNKVKFERESGNRRLFSIDTRAKSMKTKQRRSGKVTE